MHSILFVIFVHSAYVHAYSNSDQCGTWTGQRLMRILDKRNISEVITWSMSVIQYNNAMQIREEDITSGKKMRPYQHLKNVVICPNVTMVSNMERIMSIYMKLCKGLRDRRRSISLNFPNTKRIDFSSKTTMNFIVQSEFLDFNLRRAVEYFVHTSSSLGIPTLSWFAGSVGNVEMEEKRLLLHLEPGAYHVAEAIVDFLKSYKWNVVTLVVSKSLAGHEMFIKELKRVRNERLLEEHEKHFNLDISRTFYIDDYSEGISKRWKYLKENCMRYKDPGTPICPDGPFDRLLEQILKAEAKVIIFHGTKKDLYFFSFFYNKYNTTLFGKKYVWIITPAATKLKRASGGLTNGQSAELAKHAKIPGMFGFAYDNSFEGYNRALNQATRIFSYGLKEVAKVVEKDIMKTLPSNVSLSTILLPNFSCEDKSDSMHWDLGVTFYEKMKSITLKYGKERIGFLNNGYINTTQLFIMNTRVVDGLTRWFKVGTWSISDKTQPRSHLQIDGITFSGGANQPPSGMPRKVMMRVATLKERPFVVYSMPNKNNECDQNTIVCHVHPESMNTSGPPQQSDFSASGNRTNQTKACCAGLTIDLLLEIKRDLNFDVELFEVEDVTWGIQTEKGWNGLVKVLLDGKADMVVTAFKITPNRSAAVDFSIPFQETGITIAVALREGKISHTAFLEPYDFSSWCVILIFSVHACGAALFVYEWLSPQGLDRGNVAPRENHRFSLFRSLWLIWSMLFSASVNADNPRGVASRVLASIWALFALVFLASYTANLAAFMIAKEEFYDLKGIKDIRLMSPWNQKPPFRFASVPSGATEENIRINFPRMAMYMRTYNKSSVTEGIKALKNGEIDAFIYDAYVLDYLEAHDENCKLKTVRNWFAMTGYGIAFPKKSKWLKKVNEKILDYQTNGKMQRWKKFWVSGNCKKSNQLGNTNKTLGVKNFISAFILLVGGMILCTVLLLLEHAFYRYMRPRIKSWDKYGCCGLVSISMGQLLSFEQSVNQTVDLIKHHKCKNPICETQLWKARHELDMARRKIRKLETWSRNAIDTMPTSAAISYGEPTTSASIPALPSALPDSTLGATGLCHSSTPDIDFHARSEPALNEEPNSMCSCHLNNPPYPCDDATSEHSRLLPPALPARALPAQSDWRDAPSPHPLHRHPNNYHPPMANEPPGVQIRRPKSSGNIALNSKFNPPQYEMIEKESVL